MKEIYRHFLEFWKNAIKNGEISAELLNDLLKACNRNLSTRNQYDDSSDSGDWQRIKGCGTDIHFDTN